MTLAEPLRLVATERITAWGGNRLTGTAGVGELWVAHAGSVVCGGPFDGRTLEELCAALPRDLTGLTSGGTFPIIVKLLDTASWLSVQVHPDDAAAEQIEGEPGAGKTEAWHVIDASDTAEIVVGPVAGTSSAALRNSAAKGDPLPHLERRPIRSGDSVLIPARTIHTMSGGVLAYEVQQASSTTHRLYDWGRDRELHQARFWETADMRARAILEEPAARVVLACEHFRMEVHRGGSIEPPRRTFQVVTAIDGDATAIGEGWATRIAPLDSILVPACLGAYTVESSGRVVVAGPARGC